MRGNPVFSLPGSSPGEAGASIARRRAGSAPAGAAPRSLAVSADGQSLFATRFLSPRNHAELWRIDAAAASLALAETRR
ncbi:MAG: hypothetical protein N2688_15195, partial [Burkholderiaceae bacterium]|nr:hypothetical protein [Burkholderiaceae bacterium]